MLGWLGLALPLQLRGHEERPHGAVTMTAPLVDHTEAVVLAAMLDSIRNGSSLPIRRPGYAEPTYSSRPIATTNQVAVPNDGLWYDVLTWTAPIQYMSTIVEFSIATESVPITNFSFQLLLNGRLFPAVSFLAGIELCKDSTVPWPLKRRSMNVTIDQTQKLSLQAKNNGALEANVIAGFWGWSYPTLSSERSHVNGVTDD